MSKKEELKQTYMKDIELAASKSKFGFFNIPPPISAGDQTFQQKKFQRDQNGKLKTQQRNIFSGLCASGVLKKNYFSYPEYKTAGTYLDPGKADRLKKIQTYTKFKGKEAFRSSSLNKTLQNFIYGRISASYGHLPQKQIRRDPKQYRNEDGKIMTQNTNIMANPCSKIEYKKLTKLKYVSEPFDSPKIIRRKELMQDISKRSENAFKPSSPTKDYFSSNKQKYGLVNIDEKKQTKNQCKIQQHECKFKPGGSHLKYGVFSSPKYMPPQIQNKQHLKKQNLKNQSENKQPFRLIKQQKNSKPCPSISLSKMNLMGRLR